VRAFKQFSFSQCDRLALDALLHYLRGVQMNINQTKKAAYCVQWWDANGDAHISLPMDNKTARNFASSMNADQEAQIVLVYISQ